MDAEWFYSQLQHRYDLRQLLEQVKQAREELDSGGVPRLFAPEIIADHRKLDRRRINPNGKLSIPQDMAELSRRQAAHPLVPLRSKLARRLGALPGSDRMLVLADRDGFVLEREGGPSMKQQADKFRLTSAVNWAGVLPASNAVRMSVMLKKPALMLGHQHYRRDQSAVACYSAPVFGSNGRLVGFLDVVCPALAMTVDLPRLVDEVALNIRPDVDRVHHERLYQLRQEASRLRRRPASALVIDWHGWVAHAREWETDHRVAAPEGGFRLGFNELPELGLVVLEPIWGGWLVRRPSPGESIPEYHLTLDLRHRNPRRDRAGWVMIEGPTVSWEPHELSRQQAEILLLLALSGREGLTQAQLADALYAVAPAPSTTRAACKRVRDVLRAVLVSDPYRVADGVNVTVRYPADLLPGSSGPGIVRLRR